MERRIEDLEVKVAFQEHLLAQLDEVVRDLRAEVLNLREQVALFRGELDLSRQVVEDARPPHW